MGVVAILVMWLGRYEHIFVPSSRGGSTGNLVTTGLVAFEKMFEIVIFWESWVKGQTMTFTSSNHWSSCTHSDNSAFLHIWPSCKKSRSDKGHHLNNLGSTMVPYATHQVPRSLFHWFRRRRFLKVFTIYGRGGHLHHVTQLICMIFHSYSPVSFHLHLGFKWFNSEKKQVLMLKSEWSLAKVQEWLWLLILILLH